MDKHDLSDRLFWIAREDEILQGKTTDVYFLYTQQVLKHAGRNPRVAIEVFARSLPVPDNWGVVLGVYEVAKLLEGRKGVNVKAMDEGEIFQVSPTVYEPVLQVEANYADIATLENPILGFLCSASGIASRAARMRLAAGDRMLFSFGTRRAHPALAPMIERAIYIAGFDAVSNVLAAQLMNIEPIGTMPHALILAFGSQQEAWKAFDDAMPERVRRVMLVDTLYDEKAESMMALEQFGSRLYGVRLDTPSSRRGNRRRIVEEVKWELSIRGGRHVKIFVSGGLDEQEIAELRDVVDGFGVGTSVSAAPPVDFSFKVVEVDGRAVAKRGDMAGRKQVYRLGYRDVVTLAGSEAAGRLEQEGYRPLLKDLIVDGRMVQGFKGIEELRADLMARLKGLSNAERGVTWLI
ncbi:MAG: nicotinate phosphoribosyltransferase [Candidatus Nitrosocaldus sp.]|nr:nicotinate phosphoribosyltransferase [Candidatus Nitrosocaldus sp.]